ncbi:carbon-nitrogen hydrolase family protein [Synergistaceae bacterium OttesenSCG-928-I11]|nr:carbon-nitrogen hydrolase family protein [Synergistaceae bacterium OttesenSCG-928-I11]
MKAAAIQMRCKPGDVSANLEKAERLVKEAAAKGAEWVVLPELFGSGYTLDGRDRDFSEHFPDGQICRWAMEIAGKYGLLVTACSLEAEGEAIYDTAFCATADRLLGKYRKVHLWGDEPKRFARGVSLGAPVPCGEWRIGMQICYEVGFPEGSRLLAMSGANVLAYMAAFGRARLHVWDIATRARALENGCYLVAAALSAEDGGELAFAGHSRVVAPDGSVLAEAGAEDEAVVAELVPEEVVHQRESIPYLRDLNRELVKNAWSAM